jgi:hypothetical protein
MSDISKVIEDTLAQYRQCNSYFDSGIITCDGDGSEQQIHFETYFLRPAYLRFEWQKFQGTKPIGARGGFWSDGENGRVRRNASTIACAPSIGMTAVGGALSDAMHVIKFLLNSFDDPVSLPLSLAEYSIVGQEIIELLQKCYVVEDSGSGRTRRRFWISQKQLSIVQAEVRLVQSGAEETNPERNWIEREKKLSIILNRTVADRQPKVHVDPLVLSRHRYIDVDFDVPLAKSVFEFPQC